MITTSKLNNSIVFGLAIFLGPRAESRGAESGGLRIKADGRESRNTNTLTNKIITYMLTCANNFYYFHYNIDKLILSFFVDCQ